MKFVIAILAAVLANSASATILHSLGIAINEQQEPQYIEHHQYLPGGVHVARYYDTELELLVEKRLTYSAGHPVPELRQVDLTTNTRTDISLDETHSTLRQSKNGDIYRYPINESMIVDAGFDTYIRENWDLLDEPQNLTLLVAGREKTLDVRISRSAKSPNHFEIEPRNFLFRMLLPKIVLQYDAERRLTTYRGFSNMKVSPSADRKVEINFKHYILTETLAEPLPEWISDEESDPTPALLRIESRSNGN